MGQVTNIQWTDKTWNIARGCDKVSEGCKFCYMMRDGEKYGYDGTDVVRTKTVFTLPLKIKEPSKIFTSSLTDFFHPKIDSYREEAWDIIRKCPQHTFQILTKRPERINNCLPKDWGEGWNNVWMGFSAENQKRYDERFYHMAQVKAVTKFVSIEPMLDRIILWGLSDQWDFWKNELQWVIVGGESGFGKVPEDPNAKWQYRACELGWIENIVEQCALYGVACFVKQLGTHQSKMRHMTDLHGGDIKDFPVTLQVRQFPAYAHNLQ